MLPQCKAPSNILLGLPLASGNLKYPIGLLQAKDGVQFWVPIARIQRLLEFLMCMPKGASLAPFSP